MIQATCKCGYDSGAYPSADELLAKLLADKAPSVGGSPDRGLWFACPLCESDQLTEIKETEGQP